MSTRRFLSALACICTSAGLAAAAQTDATSAASLELEVARTPAVYLVLDPATGTLDIRARGLVLDTVPVEDLLVLVPQPVLGKRQRPPLELPILWRLVTVPEQSWRQVVAPEILRPYDEDEDEDEATPTATPEPGASTEPAVALPPADHLCRANTGWQLRVTSRRPGGIGKRLGDSLASGWRRLRGTSLPEQSPTLVVVVASDDARRLGHLLEPGLAVLITGP